MTGSLIFPHNLSKVLFKHDGRSRPVPGAMVGSIIEYMKASSLLTRIVPTPYK